MFTNLVFSYSREGVLVKKKKMPKKSIVRKCPQGSSFSDYDRTQFVSIDAEGPFNALVTKQSRIKELRFNINVENARMEDFKRVIHSHKWQ